MANSILFNVKSNRCSICYQEMRGIFDDSIRLVCQDCGGSHIPSGSSNKKQKKRDVA